MNSPIFITGTDTEVGKTYVTVCILKWLQQQGLIAAGVKPIASGAIRQTDGLRNEDALALQQASSQARDYSWHNPLVFEPAIAPHIAAQVVGQRLSADHLHQLLLSYTTSSYDKLLVEGAGGWMLPLNTQETLAQVIASLQWPTVLVVGMRLGCLNHALLTARAMREQGVTCLGWVANAITPSMTCWSENLQTLTAFLGEPLAVIEHGSGVPKQHSLHKILT